MKKILLLGAIATSLSGCGSLSNNYLPDEVIVDNYGSIAYFNDKGQIELSLSDIKTLNADTELRKAFIAQAISSSDKKCSQHKATIISNSSAWNVGMGSLSMLLSGTAAVISHAQTAAELAAGATAVSGIQSLANEEIYANAMGTTIVRAIEVGRAKSLASISKKLLDDSVVPYTVQSALIDVQRYHSQCSLMAGLIEVTKALDQRKLSTNEIEFKQKRLEKDIETYTKEIVAKNNLFPPTDAVKIRQEAQLAELNAQLHKLMLQGVNSAN